MSSFNESNDYHQCVFPMSDKEIDEHQKTIECKAVMYVIDIIRSLKEMSRSEMVILIIKMFLDIEYVELKNHSDQESCDACRDIAEVNLCIHLLQYNAIFVLTMCNNFNGFNVEEGLRNIDLNQDLLNIVKEFVLNMKQIQIRYANSIIQNNKQIMMLTQEVKDIVKVVVDKVNHPNYQSSIMDAIQYIDFDKEKNIFQVIQKLSQIHLEIFKDKVSELSVQFRILKNKVRQNYPKMPFSLLLHMKAVELVFIKFKEIFFNN